MLSLYPTCSRAALQGWAPWQAFCAAGGFQGWLRPPPIPAADASISLCSQPYPDQAAGSTVLVLSDCVLQSVSWSRNPAQCPPLPGMQHGRGTRGWDGAEQVLLERSPEEDSQAWRTLHWGHGLKGRWGRGPGLWQALGAQKTCKV